MVVTSPFQRDILTGISIWFIESNQYLYYDLGTYQTGDKLMATTDDEPQKLNTVIETSIEPDELQDDAVNQ